MTFDKIKEIIMETLSCDADAITMEASLMDDLGADSLDAVELSMAVEEAFDMTIDEDALANFKTVGDLVNYVEENK